MTDPMLRQREPTDEERGWPEHPPLSRTGEELAHLIGVHRLNIGRLERGARLPRLDSILKLCAGLEASPCELLAGLHWTPGSDVKGRFVAAGEATAAKETGAAP